MLFHISDWMWKNEEQDRSQSILKQQHVWLNRHSFTASWIVMHQNLFVTEMSKQDVKSTLTIMKILLQNGNGTKVYWFAASTLRKVLYCVCFIDSRYYSYFTESTTVCHMWLQHLWSTSWVSIGKRTLFDMCAANWLTLMIFTDHDIDCLCSAFRRRWVSAADDGIPMIYVVASTTLALTDNFFVSTIPLMLSILSMV